MDLGSILCTIVTLVVHWGLVVTSDPQHYCYTKLVTALVLSCDRIYSADSTTSTTTSSRSRRSLEIGTDTVRSRIPRNVVEQCCKRPCNVATLRRYCSIVRETQRLPPDSNDEPISTQSPEDGTGQNQGQRSTVLLNSRSLQSLTESPSPDPVPVGDFNL